MHMDEVLRLKQLYAIVCVLSYLEKTFTCGHEPTGSLIFIIIKSYKCIKCDYPNLVLFRALFNFVCCRPYEESSVLQIHIRHPRPSLGKGTICLQ